MSRDADDWDDAAHRFDDEPDHGLTDPAVRTAWASLLWSIPTASRILDVGCGTGSMSVLLAELGHTVIGVDSSPAMISLARAKAERHRVGVDLAVGDAADPAVHGPFDVVLSRHVTWALDDPAGAIARWLELLDPDGTLMLVEGRWGVATSTSGLAAEQLSELVRVAGATVEVRPLPDPQLWGREITDERYLLTGHRRPAAASRSASMFGTPP